MPLLGQAAMLLLFEVDGSVVPEHDDWHTHEHLPERLSIPGFVRGTRWVSMQGPRKYFVMYEVEQLATLTSPAYLERLNSPSDWTSKMMPHYRGMTRGFCALSGSFGSGLGHACALIRFKPAEGNEAALRTWLLGEALPPLASRPGLGSVHLFERGATPPMTNEQRIRGSDSGLDWVVVATGYDPAALEGLATSGLSEESFRNRGTTGIVTALYRVDYSVISKEVHR